MTPQLAEQLCMLLSLGFSRCQAAAYLGIAPTSITNAVTRDPELGAELRQAEDLQLVHPELTIIAEARKNWRAAAWYLTYKAKAPRPLSEEEKEEKHRAALADQRRSNELHDVILNGAKPERATPNPPAVARPRRRAR